MFDKDFFPTPAPVIQRLLSGLNLAHLSVLEPSAGKGDILDFIADQNAYRTFGGRKHALDRLFAIERHPELQAILREKGYQLLETDFLRYAPEQRFDLLAMNPPFSDGASHLLHALAIADGAEIRCLLNAETLANPCTAERELLAHRLRQLGATVAELGSVFRTAERPTNVNVALVTVPAQERAKTFSFQGATYGEKVYSLDDIANNQLASTDVFTSLVHRYDALKRLGRQLYQTLAEMQFYAEGLAVDPVKALKGSFAQHGDTPLDVAHERFIRTIRAEAWSGVYSQTKLAGMVTSKVQQDLETARQQQGCMAFTVENLDGLFCALLQNLGNIREACILNAFDLLTRYHKDNCVHVEGWAHNDAWQIRPKIIIPYGCDLTLSSIHRRPSLRYDKRGELLDVEKALCFVTNTPFESIEHRSLAHIATDKAHALEWGQWADSHFFQFKLFKKGTLHLRFKDRRVCDAFNLEASKGKHWLPADYGRATA